MPRPVTLAHLGDQTIAYRLEGAPQGPTLVLAHTIGFDLELWDDILPCLPATLRILRFDLRGHGRSSTPAAPYAMGALVRDAERLLDHLAIRDAVFLGSGLGGMIAQGLAVKRLDQIRALVLANTATRIGSTQSWAKTIANLQKTGLAPHIPDEMQRRFSAAFRQGNDLSKWQAKLQAQSSAGFLGCCAAIAGTDFYSTTASLRLPCLLIASSADAITPADMVREMAELIPGSVFKLIRKSGHLPMLEQPEAFAQAVGDFLHSIGHLSRTDENRTCCGHPDHKNHLHPHK